MQSISIQIQPEFLAEFDRAAFLTQVRSVGRSPEIDEFTEKGKTYLSFNFFTEFPKKLWQDLQQALYQHAEYSKIISPISTAVCEDESHPEGYLILHHFDKTEKVDQL
ncbi:MAG: hypothetical protein EOO52_00670 [Gammaproteobacteria bacterium]|nr:MAG: hypothetical protein EOO52_00670 [Gammaproteobacteria bacterium]